MQIYKEVFVFPEKSSAANLYIFFLFRKIYTFCFCCLREYSNFFWLKSFFPDSPVFLTSINRLSHIYHLIINRELTSEEILITTWLWVRKSLERVIYFLFVYLFKTFFAVDLHIIQAVLPSSKRMFFFQLKHLQKICTLKPEIVFGNWKPFKNDKKCFLSHLKSSFCSQNVYFLSQLLFK